MPGGTVLKILIAEDELPHRRILQYMLEPYGSCDTAVNGEEAVDAFCESMQRGTPYDLICLDIMMPGMDGQTVLSRIRSSEEEAGVLLGNGVKILMITALHDSNTIWQAFRAQCDGYLYKPIDKRKLKDQLTALGLTAEQVPAS